jgi:hypothetical protein
LSECFPTRATVGDGGKVLTAFTTATDGQNDLHLGILLLELDKCPQTALGAIDWHLGISPLVT